jgi:hypothetical protein
MIPTPPTPAACHAPYVLTQMRNAIGGNAWSHVGQTTAVGAATISALRGTARFDDDLKGGRYARRFSIAVTGPNAEVYDGRAVWSKDISGGVHAYDAPFPRERSITSAYLTRRVYLDPRASGTLACEGTRVFAGRHVVVIRVRPRGGIPAELAIDDKTYLLQSITERMPLSTRVTAYADYRTVGNVVLPFSISSGTQSNPSDDYAFSVTRYVLSARAREVDFEKPLPANDAVMLGGATSTTVPMLLEGRQLMIWASINGRAQRPFILDTGGHAILTTSAARTLGLRGNGAGTSGGSGTGTIAVQYARVKSIRIGGAELLNQPILVIPYPYSFSERAEKTPLAGIIGLEWFERYATRVDYGSRTVTFTPLSSFRYRGTGTPVPFTFQEDMPLVDASADGYRGLFGTDTGNAGTLILFGDFLKRTGLLTRYSRGSLVIGQARVVRIRGASRPCAVLR